MEISFDSLGSFLKSISTDSRLLFFTLAFLFLILGILLLLISLGYLIRGQETRENIDRPTARISSYASFAASFVLFIIALFSTSNPLQDSIPVTAQCELSTRINEAISMLNNALRTDYLEQSEVVRAEVFKEKFQGYLLDTALCQREGEFPTIEEEIQYITRMINNQ